MTIEIYMNGQITLSSIEYHTTGEMQGYILAVYYSDEVGEVDLCFRVSNPADGTAENIITWTSKGIAEENRKAIEMHLANLAEKCGLKEAIGTEIPDEELIFYTTISADSTTHEYNFGINGSTWYDLRQWKIAEAMDEYCTEEAIIERDIFERTAWGFYD
jgi:hypothetical protein